MNSLLLAAIQMQAPSGIQAAQAPAGYTVGQFIKDFQPLIGALLALTGVAATLLFNAAKDRRAQRKKDLAEARALTTALEQELAVFSVALREILNSLRLEFTPLSQGFSFFISRFHDSLYKANLDRLGILPAESVRAVVDAYLKYAMLVPQLYHFAHITRLDDVTMVSLEMRQGETNIAGTVGAVLPVFEGVEATVRAAIAILQAARSQH